MRPVGVEVEAGGHAADVEGELVLDLAVEARRRADSWGNDVSGCRVIERRLDLRAAVGEHDLGVPHVDGRDHVVGEDGVLPVEFVAAYFRFQTTVEIEVRAIGSHFVVAHLFVADLEAMAFFRLVGELAQAAEQVGSGARHLLAVAGGEVAAIGIVQVAEKLETVLHAICADAGRIGLAVGVEGAADEAAEIAARLQQVDGIDGFEAHRATERARSRIGGCDTRLDGHGLQQGGIEQVGAVVVEDLVVLARAVDGDREVRLVDAVDENLLRAGNRAAYRHAGLAGEYFLEIARLLLLKLLAGDRDDVGADSPFGTRADVEARQQRRAICGRYGFFRCRRILVGGVILALGEG